MFERTKKWFNHLSKAGKIGTVGASLFGLLIISSAFASSAPTQACTASERLIEEATAIPFEKSQANDANLEKGKTIITVAGVNGEKVITKKVTEYAPTGCKEATTVSVKEETTKQPIAEVTNVGTKEPAPAAAYTPPAAQAPAPAPSSCHPSYSPCVPNASYDLDCPDIGMRVSVTGPDSYRLDADNDGVGCESY